MNLIRYQEYHDKNFRIEGARTAKLGRVSSQEQKIHGLSIPAQREALNQFIIDNKLIDVGEYFDEGYSAGSLNRPALQRLIIDIKANKIDLIIFTRLDRYTRMTGDYYKLKEILDAHNVQWKAIHEDYDTFTANGQFQINMSLAFAQLERSKTSERIKSINKYKFNRKEALTSKLPYGYVLENKKIVIEPKEAEFVKFIFDKYEKMQSTRGLMLYLREFNFNRTEYGVKDLLQNKRYIGIYTHNEYGTVEDYFPPIISIEQFERVQRLLKINKQNRTNSTEEREGYVFRKLITCSVCGSKYSCSSKKRVTKNKGTYYDEYYRCPNYNNRRSCSNKAVVHRKHVEKKILDSILKEVKKVRIELHENKKNEPIIDKEKIKKKLQNIKILFSEDEITYEEYKRRKNQLEAKLNSSTTDVKLSKLEEIEKLLSDDFETIYNDLEPSEKRALMASILEYIEVDENKNITFKFFE